MKIAVVGLWHLGCVTAACLANAKYDVIAFDADEHTITQLNNDISPIFEPKLDDLLATSRKAGHLSFSSNPQDLNDADIMWVTIDTPVDDDDIADVPFVTHQIEELLPYLKNNTLVLISSQIPVGTTRQLIEKCSALFPNKPIHFAYSPENLRLGKAIDIFTKPDRVVVGIQHDSDKERICALLSPFATDNIIWMSIESAEMTKHAINAFLATSVTFINELSVLCERVGADAREVERGLKSEERIGSKAYLRPGNAIAGGTLARDVNFLIDIGIQQKQDTPLFAALLASNHAHKQWSCQRIMQVMQSIKNKSITLLGLTYKAGTDTLRRSTAVEMGEWLSHQGATVSAYDPAITELPNELTHYIQLQPSMDAALTNADIIVIANECPDFIDITVDKLLSLIKHPIIFDASGFLMKTLGNDDRVRYFSVGRQA